MSKHLIPLAAILALSACSGGVTSEAQLVSLQTPPDAQLEGPPPLAVPHAVPPAPALVQNQTARLWCEITVTRTPIGVRIAPVVRSPRSVTGEYSLVITRSDRSGSSDISQGGPFDARRDEKQELGASELSLEPGAKFRAVLKVRSGGQEVCREIRS